jgi:hypothetical protein
VNSGRRLGRLVEPLQSAREIEVGVFGDEAGNRQAGNLFFQQNGRRARFLDAFCVAGIREEGEVARPGFL